MVVIKKSRYLLDDTINKQYTAKSIDVMKIIILNKGNNTKSGIEGKTLSQVSSLRELGVDCRVLFIRTQPLNFPDYPFIDIVYIKEYPKWNLFLRIISSRKIADCIQNTISTLSHGDYFYLRYPFPLLSYPKIFFKKSRPFKIIFEHNTIEPKELWLVKYYIQYFREFFFGRFLRERADAFIGVTEEITQYQSSFFEDADKPHITIGNGFDVESVPLRNLKPFNNTELHLLCVANVSKWHGLDRLLKGMAIYRGNTPIIFHIAGEGAELPLLKQLVEKLNLQNHLIFHGFKTGEDLDTLFNSCHIAVGSLGIHRIGLKEASILKAREYCARGIPFIIACADPDFPDDFPYIYRVPPDESLIDVERIIEFAQTVCADLDHPRKMRAYALEHLDWSVKMKKLKAFLETLVISEPKSIA